MNAVPFEARYLDVAWLDRDTVQRLSASVDSIPVEEQEGAWSIDTQVFKAARLRLGFRVLDVQLTHPPYFLVDESAREELLAIVDPRNGCTWWIENSGWDPERRRYHSRLQRTVGTARLHLQGRLLTIRNHSLNFTTDELEAYLSDFKSDLWALIFDPRGVVQGKVGKNAPSVLGQELLHQIREFTSAAERIGERMEVELKEIVELRPLRSVRPIVATFREVAVRGCARQLSSRGFAELKDTAVNRYAHHLVNKMRFMVGQLQRMALAQKSGLETRAQQHLASAAEIASQQFNIVDEAVFRSELAKFESELAAARQSVNEQDAARRPPRTRPVQGYTFKLRPIKPKSQESNVIEPDGRRFNCIELDGEDFKETFGTYCMVTLPKQIGTHVAKLSQNGQRGIKLLGSLTKSAAYDKNGKKFYTIEFDHIERIEFVGPTAADESRKRMDALAANSWRMPLTPRERQELQHESKALAVRAAAQKARAGALGETLDELDALDSRLRKLGRLFRTLNIGISSTLPQSMTYVRNPRYFALKTAYNKLNNLAGTEDDVLDAMMDVEDMGLVNVSNLYEKWCLLQMIKVLRDGFGFEPSKGWQKTLVDGVLGRSHDISLALTGAGRWAATLIYEKVLTNKRRPDFVFDLTVPLYEQTKTKPLQWFDSGDSTTTRFVMDAKFRERWRPGELAELLEELCVRKNYSEGGENSVFILHPCEEHAQQRTSPLTWGRGSDYGQLHNHERGAIRLSPRRVNGSTIDNLHRLFGMMFQEASNYLRDDSGWQWTDALCIGCGRGVDASEVRLKYSTTKAGKEKWELGCRTCQLVSVRTNCYGCGARLFKNGHYWTYHRTRAESLSNVVCPKCERFFDNASSEAV
ncbi:hypothetical protein [Massilia sp. H6]|uniref:hypothetical protein n=1 Tax=Massilia sp. H6 TaxID=2970464 RepID=UPI002168DC7C|nr:hypothetical protein [Massilia sp. H6]UVW30701.1 hypothetical protein NRS07_19890 [Massilia sp. H6]